MVALVPPQNTHLAIRTALNQGAGILLDKLLGVQKKYGKFSQPCLVVNSPVIAAVFTTNICRKTRQSGRSESQWRFTNFNNLFISNQLVYSHCSLKIQCCIFSSRVQVQPHIGESSLSPSTQEVSKFCATS